MKPRNQKFQNYLAEKEFVHEFQVTASEQGRYGNQTQKWDLRWTYMIGVMQHHQGFCPVVQLLWKCWCVSVKPQCLHLCQRSVIGLNFIIYFNNFVEYNILHSYNILIGISRNVSFLWL